MSPIEGNFQLFGKRKACSYRARCRLGAASSNPETVNEAIKAQRRAVHLRQCRARTAISRSLADVTPVLSTLRASISAAN